MDNPYVGRYPLLEQRRGVWREIVRAVRPDAGQPQTVLELGAGYCDFINQFSAPRKIAFDLNPKMRDFAAADVDFRAGDACRLEGVEDASVDLVFASNFLEHLDRDELEILLPNIRRVLAPRGRLMLIQPNYRRCADVYFSIDDTHKTAFSDDDIASTLTPHGLAIVRLVPGYLPLTMKSRLPKWSILTRLYLLSPIKPLAAQMYVVAEKR